MAYNKLLILDDVGRRFTTMAGSALNGGDLVVYGGVGDSVGSVVTTYAATDIYVLQASGTAGTLLPTVLGIAQQSVSSGGVVTILQQGMFILPAGSNGITGGKKVGFVGYQNMCEVITSGSADPGKQDPNAVIGRAMTSATDQTKLAIVRLNV